MCNIVEEYVAKRLAEAKAEATNNTLNSIKNLMKNTHWSAEKAIEAIGIPKSDFTRYLALLRFSSFPHKPQFSAAYFYFTKKIKQNPIRPITDSRYISDHQPRFLTA